MSHDHGIRSHPGSMPSASAPSPRLAILTHAMYCRTPGIFTDTHAGCSKRASFEMQIKTQDIALASWKITYTSRRLSEPPHHQHMMGPLHPAHQQQGYNQARQSEVAISRCRVGDSHTQEWLRSSHSSQGGTQAGAILFTSAEVARANQQVRQRLVQ